MAKRRSNGECCIYKDTRSGKWKGKFEIGIDVKAVNKMRAATRIEDIMRDHGLRYERLHGDRKDQESVRCNDVWRLIFQSSPADGSIIITEIELIEISHHYD